MKGRTRLNIAAGFIERMLASRLLSCPKVRPGNTRFSSTAIEPSESGPKPAAAVIGPLQALVGRGSSPGDRWIKRPTSPDEFTIRPGHGGWEYRGLKGCNDKDSRIYARNRSEGRSRYVPTKAEFPPGDPRCGEACGRG